MVSDGGNFRHLEAWLNGDVFSLAGMLKGSLEGRPGHAVLTSTHPRVVCWAHLLDDGQV